MAQTRTMQRREANLTLELYAASKRLSEQVMRFEMVYEYLLALFEMRLTYLANATEYGVLEKGLEKLQRQQKSALRRQGFLKGGSYDQAVQSYAQISSLLFATKIQSRLPRELRDLCYSYIWDADYLQETQKRMVSSLQGFNQPIFGPKVHVIDPKYMDPATAREVIEAYCKHAPSGGTPFLATSPCRIARFIHNDFGLGIKSAQLLRTLSIQLHLVDLYGRGLGEIDVPTLQKDLALLLDIEKKKGFKLDIAIIQRRIRLKQWDQIFAILTPIFREFEAAGADVHITWEYDRGFGEQPPKHCLNDLVRKWHPELNWKDEAIAWLQLEDVAHYYHMEWMYEDMPDYDSKEYDINEPYGLYWGGSRCDYSDHEILDGGLDSDSEGGSNSDDEIGGVSLE